MKIKDNTVNIYGLDVRMRHAMRIADDLWGEYGEELVITSARDSMHSAGSFHYYGLAIDCRTRYFNATQIHSLSKQLEKQLKLIDERYQVIVHSTHIHIELQVN